MNNRMNKHAVDFSGISKNKQVKSKNGTMSDVKEKVMSEQERSIIKKGRRCDIDIDRLEHSSLQARSYYDEDDLKSLASSIEQEGMYHPLIVWPKKNSDKFMIVSGNRRYLANKMLGTKKLHCIVPNDLEKAQLAASSTNELAKDLHELDKGREALTLKNTVYKNEPSQVLIGKLMNHYNVSKGKLYTMFKYGAIPEKIRRFVIENKINKKSLWKDLADVCSDIDNETDLSNEELTNEKIKICYSLLEGTAKSKTKSVPNRSNSLRNFIYHRDGDSEFTARMNVINKLSSKEKAKFKKFLIDLAETL